jgi:hypothetical protein
MLYFIDDFIAPEVAQKYRLLSNGAAAPGSTGSTCESQAWPREAKDAVRLALRRPVNGWSWKRTHSSA